MTTSKAAAAAIAACLVLTGGGGIATGHDARFDSRVRITGYIDNASFLGRVASDRKQCKRKRRVTVWRRNPGAMDAPVGTAKSNGKGNWAVSAPSAPSGRYFATAKKRVIKKAAHKHVCKRARSKVFEL